MTRSPVKRARKLILLLITIIWLSLTLTSLSVYYAAYHKAPDWYGLKTYLDNHATSQDVILMTSVDPLTGNADPAFDYYYPGPAAVITLPHPGYDNQEVIQKALAEHRAVWFIPVGDQARVLNDVLLANGQLISEASTGRSFLARQYRGHEVQPSEIEYPTSLQIGSGLLDGYSLSGVLQTDSTLSVLLYWQTAPTANLTTFVHLIGAPKADGSPLWAQEDHPPTAPGRDVYHLTLEGLPPGEYSIEIGMYDPSTLKRVDIIDATGNHTDSYILTKIRVGN